MHQIYLSAGKALGCKSCRMPEGAKPTLEEMGCDGGATLIHVFSQGRAQIHENPRTRKRMRQAAKHRVSVAI